MDEDADVPRHPDVGMLRVLLGAPLRGGVGAQVNTYVYAIDIVCFFLSPRGTFFRL